MSEKKPFLEWYTDDGSSLIVVDDDTYDGHIIVRIKTWDEQEARFVNVVRLSVYEWRMLAHEVSWGILRAEVEKEKGSSRE